MSNGHRVFHSCRQFNGVHRKQTPMPNGHHVGGEWHSPRPPRSACHASASGVQQGPPPHPIRVTPIQSYDPSLEKVAILPPPTPAPHVPVASSMPLVTPVSPMETSTSLHDMALGLQKDRQAFYVKVTSVARASMKMDIPKPALRSPIQPPCLFHLLACGLLKFNLECGEF